MTALLIKIAMATGIVGLLLGLFLKWKGMLDSSRRKVNRLELENLTRIKKSDIDRAKDRAKKSGESYEKIKRKYLDSLDKPK